jgi:S1-C subfamily serine protease
MTRILMTLFIFFAGAAVCLTNGSAGKIFKWVDADGVVHFSDRPPDGSQSPGGPVEERLIQEESNTRTEEAPPLRQALNNPIEYATHATFAIKNSGATGSGFFISSDGLALTCKHVLQGGADHVAFLTDEKQHPISVISESHVYDLALLRVMTTEKTLALQFRDSDTLVPGDRVLAVGTPVGLQATVTDGVFTGLRKPESSDQKVIQFSAPINPGNSGGPLLDEEGKVVGVVSSKYLMRNGIPLAGLGFALPSNVILETFAVYIK